MDLERNAWQKLGQMHSRTLGMICIVIVLIILVAGLWPFDFFPGNKVEWLTDRSGVHFYGQGMIVSAETLNDFQNPPFPGGSITLELWLRPLLETDNLPSILTLYDGKTPDILMIGQWRSHLIIRSRSDDPTARKRRKPYLELGFINGLLKNREVFITITSSMDGSMIYINGRLAQAYPHRCLLAETSSERILMILGNAPTGQSHWNGNLMALAIHNRAFTAEQVFRSYEKWTRKTISPSNSNGDLCLAIYRFEERSGLIVNNACGAGPSLTIPAMFEPPTRTILDPPWNNFQLNGSLVSDVTVNILGFIPFGFIFAAFLSSVKRCRCPARFIWTTVLLTGLCLSLGIELAQVYLPSRFSQLSDLVCNTLGTALGTFVFYHCMDNKMAEVC